MAYISINGKTVKQVEVLARIERRELTQEEGSLLLQLSVRSIQRKLARYREGGIESLQHRNKGKANNRKITEEQELLIVGLLEGPLHDSGPTFLSEKLQELHRISICNESIRQILLRRGKWVAHTQRPTHRKRRPRRVRLGMLVQLDGSPHDWFEGRGPWCTLLVFIDDATSTILWLEFVTGESVLEVMQATQHYLEKHGRPLEFYVDHGSVWSVNTRNPDRDKFTQFERAMQELEINIIHASSPQAKGRVERANQTLQDRLVKEMRLRNISSIATANAYVRDTYLAYHNVRFAVAPAESTNMHRSLESFDLRHILCIRETRTVQSDYVVQYHKQLLQLSSDQPAIVRPKNQVTVSYHLDGMLSVSIRKTQLAFTIVNKRPEKLPTPKVYKERIYAKPTKAQRPSCWHPPLRLRTEPLSQVAAARASRSSPTNE